MNAVRPAEPDVESLSSFEQTRLCELVRARHGSVRLRNALELAETRGRLPFETVAQYLASPAPIAELCSEVRNLGIRTAHELDRMIRDGAPAGISSECASPLAEDELAGALSVVRAELAQLPLRSLISHAGCPTRVARVLSGPMGERSCGLAIEEPRLVRDGVMLAEGAGLATVTDFERELRLFASRHVRRCGFDRVTHDALMAHLFSPATGAPWLTAAGRNHGAEAAAEVVRSVLDGVTCASVFEKIVVQARLARMVRYSGVGDRLLADALTDRAAFEGKLAGLPAIGRRTIVQFWEICWRGLALALARHGVDAASRKNLAATLGIDARCLEAHADDLAEHLLPRPATGDGASCVAVPVGLGEIIDYLLARIRPLDATVVRRRFSLTGDVDETLEEIGSDLGVTRERIRQLEKRGLRDLRTTARANRLVEALAGCWPRAWEALADGDDLITDHEFAAFRRLVPGSIRLALEILDLDLAEWLSRVSRRYPCGWLSPSRDPAAVDRVIEQFNMHVAPTLLPRALSELGLCGARPDIEAAVIIGRGKQIVHGYLVDGRIGSRRRRALMAHAVLARMRRPTPIGDLLRDCHRAAPADACTMRDLTIVMSIAPHLFLEVSDGRWAAIGSGGEIPAGGRARACEPPEEDGPAEQDLTVADAIREELARTGPQSLSSLMDSPRRYLPRDRSPNSVLPTLYSRSDMFIRVLPSVFSLWSQVPSREAVLSGPVPYLLDPQQARFFALARRAQEPWGTFPMWSPEAEYRLCRWAAREGPTATFRSLLAAATVELWPIDEADRLAWQDRARREGRFDLVGAIRPAAFAARPELDRVLAALVDLTSTGRTSWMALNRVDGRQVVSQLGCGLLATLILCGAVIPGDPHADSGWQLQHVVSSRRAEVLQSALENELHRTGRLDWGSEPGRMLAASVCDGGDLAPDWLPSRRFMALFRIEPSGPEGETVVDDCGVFEVGRTLLSERRRADLLDWLDEQ
jgi:hypothetical protein